MGLTKYKQKRNFTETPEPNTGKVKSGKKLSFVIQRHQASHLHYDFRLEMDGVLKSWAVPKGPSMVAGEKRLAMMVEDHPLSYGKFYGEIPEGNYGAGTVEIWDFGSYEAMENTTRKTDENLLLEQLKKGDIKLNMHGKYLNGTFALVQMKNDEKGNSWLLIKKNDEFAVKKYNIESIEPLKSKREKKKSSVAEKAKPAPKKKAATQKSKASNVKTEKLASAWGIVRKPMLAKLSENLVDSDEWIYEPKYDGYRGISKISQQKAEMVSRNGNSFTQKYASIISELKNITDDVILDGEVVIEDTKGISNFQLLQNYDTTKEGKLKYYVFDILFLNGHRTTEMPLLQRKELLDAFFDKYSFKNIFKSDVVTSKGEQLYKKLEKKGFEGIIAKEANSAYYPNKRSDVWLKIKTSQMQETVICGYTSPQKSRKHFGSLILGLYEDGELKYIGNCGTGFTEASLKELHADFEKLKTEKSPFKEKITNTKLKGKPTWLKPKLVCNVKFQGWTQEGHMRIPVFQGLRSDKKSIDVKKEKTQPHIRNGRDHSFLTNLNKIYFPKENITKGEIIDYYQRIAKYILPYLKDRPLSLNRHPNGIEKPGFYQKDMNTDQIPTWAKTAEIYSKSNDANIDYLICNNEATLIYMANLGCIEINPWHSRYKKEDNPDYVMMDLDPGKIDFKYVVDTALTIKEICDELDIPCYCKTSGATGLHIFIPLAAKYTYDEVKTFAELLAILTHERLPKFTSIERAISKRKNKVYIDFLQNRKGQTIASVYSARPKPGATVSTPLKWEEVNHNLSPKQFTIYTIEERIKKVGDLWEDVLGKGISLKMVLKKIDKL